MDDREELIQLLRQKLIGLVLMLLCVIATIVQIKGHPGDRDATAPLLFFCLGLYLMRTEKIWL